MNLFYNGIIHTMDPNLSEIEAVLIDDNGRITAVGKLAELNQSNAERIDGRLVWDKLTPAVEY